MLHAGAKQAALFDTQTIHSTAHHAPGILDAAGIDLDRIECYRYDPAAGTTERMGAES